MTLLKCECMRKICFITGSRADYGIMAPLMKRVRESDESQLQIIATNMHLSPSFGMTVNEILNDGFEVDERVESLLSGDTPSATVKSMGLTQIGMADALTRLQPDICVILGDRYEMLAAASAALIFRIPVAHLHGGETTEGAYDDSIRHAITKLSWLHFASTQEYADRIIRMGENPERVFYVGAPGVDNIRNTETLSLEKLEDEIDFKLGHRYIVATYHPVTNGEGSGNKQILDFLKALEEVLAKEYKVLFTMPNSDTGGALIGNRIRDWGEKHHDSVKVVTSLGRKKFYSALRYSRAIVGNSSSGLIEAPSFGIPTLNVGDRQKGRARGESVIDVTDDYESIRKGLERVLSDEYRRVAEKASNPYEKSGTVDAILNGLLKSDLSGVKSFYE